jgi:hypothetical protein
MKTLIAVVCFVCLLVGVSTAKAQCGVGGVQVASVPFGVVPFSTPVGFNQLGFNPVAVQSFSTFGVQPVFVPNSFGANQVVVNGGFVPFSNQVLVNGLNRGVAVNSLGVQAVGNQRVKVRSTFGNGVKVRAR